MSVQAHLVKPPLKEPGDFHYVTERIRNNEGKVEYVSVGLVYMCPSGSGELVRLGFKETSDPKYTWDGNKDQPSITPAIPASKDCGSVWLTSGEFVPVEEF